MLHCTAALQYLPASAWHSGSLGVPILPGSMALTPYMTESEAPYLEKTMAYETRRHSFSPAFLIRRAYTTLVLWSV